MDTSTAYIATAIAALVIVAVLVFVVRGSKRENRLTPLTGLAFALVAAGIVFGDDRLIGYALMGGGVVLAIVDIVTRSRKGP